MILAFIDQRSIPGIEVKMTVVSVLSEFGHRGSAIFFLSLIRKKIIFTISAVIT